MFSIKATDLHWMEGTDSAKDLCLHGKVTVIIGNETLEYDPTSVSAAALSLLKSIKQDHRINESIQMLPCCGFFMIANEDLTSVDILGCPNGVDWSVLHENGAVVLLTEAGERAVVPVDVYQTIVFAFADKIEAFYRAAEKKVLPKDVFERNGYIAFWNEWKALRYGI